MPKFKDLTGQRFGRLVVINKGERHVYPNGSTRNTWICECDCGNIVSILSNDLTTGKTKSCGCFRSDKMEESKSVNLTGMRFGRLTVKQLHDKRVLKNGKKEQVWECMCDCGNTTYAPTGRLNRGGVLSCGCLNNDILKEMNTTHGMSHTRINNVFQNMVQRCYDKDNVSYKDYGARGITICDEWLNDRSKFFEWAYKNGYDEKADFGECTIDRIDVDKGYCPENCRWVDKYTQNNNQRSNINLTFNGETHTLAEWARIKNMNRGTLYSRIVDYKWSVEKALSTPVK